jgi:hypothetical protein
MSVNKMVEISVRLRPSSNVKTNPTSDVINEWFRDFDEDEDILDDGVEINDTKHFDEEITDRHTTNTTKDYGCIALLALGEPDDLVLLLQQDHGLGPAAGGAAAHPYLSSLLDVADPTRTLEELAASLELQVEEVYNMAKHLQSWGFVRIIPVLTAASILQVHPRAPLSSRSPTARDFHMVFLGVTPPTFNEKLQDDSHLELPLYNMACVLAVFNGSRPLGNALSLLPTPLQTHGVDICVWLLRRRLLVIKDPNDALVEQCAMRKLKAMYKM